ncbi:MAG: hypothetical protein JOZ45_06605 [Acidobacteriaceae bacterium]|nr:hypothetical protein [Acidobacteriaceae bacterium]
MKAQILVCLGLQVRYGGAFGLRIGGSVQLNVEGRPFKMKGTGVLHLRLQSFQNLKSMGELATVPQRPRQFQSDGGV